MDIRIDDLTSPAVAQLLEAHMQDMRRWTPAESIYALDLDSLRTPDITFWTVWEDDNLICCGALREIDATHGPRLSRCILQPATAGVALPACWSRTSSKSLASATMIA